SPALYALSLFSRLPRPPVFTLFPYTTLFRSQRVAGQALGGLPTDLHGGVGYAGARRRRLGRREQVATALVGRTSGRDDVEDQTPDRKSTRLNSSHSQISYAVFCLKKKKNKKN